MMLWLVRLRRRIFGLSRREKAYLDMIAKDIAKIPLKVHRRSD